MRHVIGLATSGGSTALWLMGIITPYLAFVGIVLGIAASVYSILVSRKQAQLTAMEKARITSTL